MNHVLFVDSCCPAPYRISELLEGALAPSQAALLRLATLFARHHPVAVAERGLHRTSWTPGGPRFLPWDGRRPPDTRPPDAVVVRDDPEALTRLREMYPRARLLLWRHAPGDDVGRARALWACHVAGATLVVGTHTHARALRDDPVRRRAPVRVAVQPSPLSTRRLRRRTEYDPDLLVHVAGQGDPGEAIARFRRLRQRLPSLRLEVALHDDPTQRVRATSDGAGVTLVRLRSASHRRRLVREAMALFHPLGCDDPQGMPLAEANILGVPVCAAPTGALPEVLGDPRQLVDPDDLDELADRLAGWRDHGAPRPRPRPELQPVQILASWTDLLRADHALPRATRRPPTTDLRLLRARV